MAKKKIEEKLTSNEVQEDIVDLMKEISNNPAIETKNDVEEDTEEKAVEEVVETVEEVGFELPELDENNNFEIEANISDGIIDNLKQYQLLDGKIDMTNANNDEIVNLTHDLLENNDIEELTEMFDATQNNNAPRMTYKQMMGYDWNGQNFDNV